MSDVAAGRPWWYLTPTMEQSGVLGGIEAGAGLILLVVYLLYGGHIWYLFFSIAWLVLGSIYLASAVARSRRER